MNTAVKWAILITLIFLAISFYSYGSTTGMFVFIILGFLFEGAFWLKLFGRKAQKP